MSEYVDFLSPGATAEMGRGGSKAFRFFLEIEALSSVISASALSSCDMSIISVNPSSSCGGVTDVIGVVGVVGDTAPRLEGIRL